MNLILVSGRFADPAARHEADAEFARGLAAAGCAVRWIVPTAAATPTPATPTPATPTPATSAPATSAAATSAAATSAAEEVIVVPVCSKTPAFSAVQARLLDGETERVLTTAIRQELPDLVHVLDYGGATSVNASWSAVRMGTPTLVSAQRARTLCHRGDLVHVHGDPCSEWNDPTRCATCCLTASPSGLGCIGSLLGRILSGIRSPLNPYPTRLDFVNRSELLLGGLQVVDRIIVETERDKEDLKELGLREDLFEILPSPSIADWQALYARVVH